MGCIFVLMKNSFSLLISELPSFDMLEARHSMRVRNLTCVLGDCGNAQATRRT